MATKSENTRVSTDVLNEARVYCKSTGRILQRFIDDAITEQLKRVNLYYASVLKEDFPELAKVCEHLPNKRAEEIEQNGETIEKGDGW